MTDTAKILVVDDEPGMLENLDRLLAAEGYQVRTLQDPLRFRQLRADFAPDVLLTDLRMPGADGMTLLTVAHADDPALPVILLTGHGTVSSAVQAMQEGAFDYLAKPFSADQLMAAVRRAVRHRRLVVENRDLKERMDRAAGDGDIIGMSAPFRRILEQVERMAGTDVNVLLTGESGTGKEVVARLVHRLSRREHAPFIPVDCAALPEGLLESELFGHEKGAFTGAVARRTGLLEEADGGTVFLDEIAELTMPLQSKLLRALEQRQVRHLGTTRLIDLDVRVVAATNVPLEDAVRDGTFREDLYYRLNVVQLRLPPLRERREDIPLLAERFLEDFAGLSGRQVPRVSPEVWDVLQAYAWPGNIRQLRNVVHRVVALDDDGRITLADIPTEIRAGPGSQDPPSAPLDDLPLDYEKARERAHRAFLTNYLDRLLSVNDGNISRAARTAGVSRRTVHRWLAEIDAGGKHADCETG